MSHTSVVMSSAKITSLKSFPSTLMPLIWSLFRMLIANNSRAIMKRYGDRGSPWRTPRLSWKKGVAKPLLKTQLDIFL